MPGYDGTGPAGKGPLTGGARGYCAIPLEEDGSPSTPFGLAGLRGMPIRVALGGLVAWACGRGLYGLARRRGWGRGVGRRRRFR